MDVARPDPCRGEAKAQPRGCSPAETPFLRVRPCQGIKPDPKLVGLGVGQPLYTGVHTLPPPGWVTLGSCPTDRDPQALPMAPQLSGASSGLVVVSWQRAALVQSLGVRPREVVCPSARNCHPNRQQILTESQLGVKQNPGGWRRRFSCCSGVSGVKSQSQTPPNDSSVRGRGLLLWEICVAMEWEGRRLLHSWTCTNSAETFSWMLMLPKFNQEWLSISSQRERDEHSATQHVQSPQEYQKDED